MNSCHTESHPAFPNSRTLSWFRVTLCPNQYSCFIRCCLCPHFWEGPPPRTKGRPHWKELPPFCLIPCLLSPRPGKSGPSCIPRAASRRCWPLCVGPWNRKMCRPGPQVESPPQSDSPPERPLALHTHQARLLYCGSRAHSQ